MRLVLTLLSSLVTRPRPAPPPRHARTSPAPQRPPVRPAVPAPRKSPEPSPDPAPATLPKRTAPRTRPYVCPPLSPPEHNRFRAVDARHQPLWRLVFDPAQHAPFQAHHRVDIGIVLASSDLDALDFALSEFTPPPYARAFLDRRGRSVPPSGLAKPVPQRALAGVR